MGGWGLGRWGGEGPLSLCSPGVGDLVTGPVCVLCVCVCTLVEVH